MNDLAWDVDDIEPHWKIGHAGWRRASQRSRRLIRQWRWRPRLWFNEVVVLTRCGEKLCIFGSEMGWEVVLKSMTWASVGEVAAEALSCFQSGVKKIHTGQIVFRFPSMQHSPTIVIHTWAPSIQYT